MDEMKWEKAEGEERKERTSLVLKQSIVNEIFPIKLRRERSSSSSPPESQDPDRK